jgi:C4-type Zn-finger protein
MSLFKVVNRNKKCKHQWEEIDFEVHDGENSPGRSSEVEGLASAGGLDASGWKTMTSTYKCSRCGEQYKRSGYL